MAENHLDFIFMKKDSKDSQIYRVGEPELAGLLLAIPVASADANAFNDAINNYLGAATATGLNVLLTSDRVAKIPRDTFNQLAEDNNTPLATDDQFKPSVYFNKANDVRFGHMYAVTFDANGAVNPPNGTGDDAEYVTLSFTPEDIVILKSIIKGDSLENLATKIQLVTQSFRLLYSKILGDAITDPKMTVNTKITDIINVAVATAGEAFKAYCGVLVDIGITYDKGTENFDGISVELDINYPVGATPVIIDQRPITNSIQVNNLFKFAKTCLGATVTNLTGGYKIGGFKKRRTKRRKNKSSKRRSQKGSKRGRKRSNKRSNKRKGKKSRRRMRKSYKK